MEEGERTLRMGVDWTPRDYLVRPATFVSYKLLRREKQLILGNSNKGGGTSVAYGDKGAQI